MVGVAWVLELSAMMMTLCQMLAADVLFLHKIILLCCVKKSIMG